MDWTLFWVAAGSLFAGGALVFAIFAWYVDRREKDHLEARHQFFEDIYKFESRTDKAIEKIEDKIEELKASLAKVEGTLGIQAEKYLTMTNRFADYAKEMRRIVESQGKEIEKLGKVLRR